MLELSKQREAHGWNKTELARRSGIQQSDIGRFESGRSIPYQSQLQKLATALGYRGDPKDLLIEVTQ